MDSMIKIKPYKKQLLKLQSFLKEYEDKLWLPMLDKLILALEELEKDPAHPAMIEHVKLTQGALQDQGLLAGMVISPQAGHKVPDNQRAILDANSKLLLITDKLNRSITKIMKRAK